MRSASYERPEARFRLPTRRSSTTPTTRARTPGLRSSTSPSAVSRRQHRFRRQARRTSSRPRSIPYGGSAGGSKPRATPAVGREDGPALAQHQRSDPRHLQQSRSPTSSRPACPSARAFARHPQRGPFRARNRRLRQHREQRNPHPGRSLIEVSASTSAQRSAFTIRSTTTGSNSDFRYDAARLRRRR